MEETSKKRRVAIIGCGHIGQAHTSSVLDSEVLELIAVADLNSEALEKTRARVPQVHAYTDALEMLDREHPDFVVVGTTALSHCKLAMAALEAGADVLCEKPIAVSLEDADRMIACAKRKGKMLLVNNEYNVNPRTLAAKKLVEEGQIGEIIGLRCSFKGNFPAGWDIIEGGCHLFCLAMLFAGAPQWVVAHITTGNKPATVADIYDSKNLKVPTGLIVGDRITALIGFNQEILLEAEFRTVKTNSFLEINGTKGVVHLPMGASRDQVCICRKPYANPNDPNAGWEIVPADWGKLERYEMPSDRAFGAGYACLEQWLIPNGAKPHSINGKHPMDGEFARNSLEMIHGVFESHFQGGVKVRLPMEARDNPLARRVEAERPVEAAAR